MDVMKGKKRRRETKRSGLCNMLCTFYVCIADSAHCTHSHTASLAKNLNGLLCSVACACALCCAHLSALSIFPHSQFASSHTKNHILSSSFLFLLVCCFSLLHSGCSFFFLFIVVPPTSM